MLKFGLLNPAVLALIARIRFKQRVPGAVGLSRTGDTIPCANRIVEPA